MRTAILLASMILYDGLTTREFHEDGTKVLSIVLAVFFVMDVLELLKEK